MHCNLKDRLEKCIDCLLLKCIIDYYLVLTIQMYHKINFLTIKIGLHIVQFITINFS